MGTVLRAVFAFAVAFSLADPRGFASVFETPRLAAVKAELAAAHPGASVQLMLENGLKTLKHGRPLSR
jgi:hypothetical protein